MWHALILISVESLEIVIIGIIITHLAQVVSPGVDDDSAPYDAVDAIEAEPVVHHVYGGHPRHVRLDVTQVPHMSGLVTRGAVTHLQSTFCHEVLYFKVFSFPYT